MDPRSEEGVDEEVRRGAQRDGERGDAGHGREEKLEGKVAAEVEETDAMRGATG